MCDRREHRIVHIIADCFADNSQGIESEFFIYRYNDNDMKYLYMCCKCDHVWNERSELRVYDRRKHRRVWRAQRALALNLLYIEMAGERIVTTEASTKLSFLFFFLVGYSIFCT